MIDRLFTYARGESLNETQLWYLKNEGAPAQASVAELVRQVEDQVNTAITLLKAIDASTLADFRGVGRKQLPSTVIISCG